MTKAGPGTSPVASGQVSGEVGGEVSGEVDGKAGEKPVTVNLDIQRLNALLQYCEEARSRIQSSQITDQNRQRMSIALYSPLLSAYRKALDISLGII